MNEHENHIMPLKTYLKVIGFLLLMTIFTVWISGVNLGPFNMLIAMTIATVKAVVVCLWFMHLKYDGNENRVMILVGVFFLLVMFVFSYGDIITRVTHQSTL